MIDCGCFVRVNSMRFRRRNIVESSVLWGTDRTDEPKQEGLGEITSLLPSWELCLSTVDVLEVEKEGATTLSTTTKI